MPFDVEEAMKRKPCIHGDVVACLRKDKDGKCSYRRYMGLPIPSPCPYVKKPDPPALKETQPVDDCPSPDYKDCIFRKKKPHSKCRKVRPGTAEPHFPCPSYRPRQKRKSDLSKNDKIDKPEDSTILYP